VKDQTMNAKTTLVAAALVSLAGAAFAQSAIPPNDWTNSALRNSKPAAAAKSSVTTVEVRAALDAARPSPFADSYPSRGTVHRPFTAQLSRAEVNADLQIYRESGLAQLENGETVAFNSPAYEAAQAKYAELRSSPYYASLVQRFAGQGTERQNLAAAN
jgi:hypothetical protein